MYQSCLGKEDLINADVVYCLSFAIVMLNTDLHNNNLKEETKMTLGDFVKYNTLYNKEQTCPLKKELLEGIYHSIKQEQLMVVDDVRKRRGSQV